MLMIPPINPTSPNRPVVWEHTAPDQHVSSSSPAVSHTLMIMSLCQWHPAVLNHILCVGGDSEAEAHPLYIEAMSPACTEVWLIKTDRMTWLWPLWISDAPSHTAQLHVSPTFDKPTWEPSEASCRMHNLIGSRQSIPKAVMTREREGGRKRGGHQNFLLSISNCGHKYSLLIPVWISHLDMKLQQGIIIPFRSWAMESLTWYYHPVTRHLSWGSNEC